MPKSHILKIPGQKRTCAKPELHKILGVGLGFIRKLTTTKPRVFPSAQHTHNPGNLRSVKHTIFRSHLDVQVLKSLGKTALMQASFPEVVPKPTFKLVNAGVGARQPPICGPHRASSTKQSEDSDGLISRGQICTSERRRAGEGGTDISVPVRPWYGYIRTRPRWYGDLRTTSPWYGDLRTISVPPFECLFL